MSIYIALLVLLILFFMIRLKTVFFFIAVVFILLILRSSVFIVNEGSQVVLTQFGKIIGKPYTQAGLYLKLPFIWKANFFDKRLFTEHEYKAKIPTQDINFISIDTTINWRISDASIFYQNIDSTEHASLFVKNLVSGSLREKISNFKLVDSVRSLPTAKDFSEEKLEIKLGKESQMNVIKPVGVYSKALFGRTNLINNILKDVNSYINGYGIEIVGVLITNITYTVEVKGSIFERMILDCLTNAEKIRSIGRAKFESIQGLIAKEYQTIIAPAQKKALLIKGSADAKATQIYAEAYGPNAVFYNFWRTLTAYENGIPPMNQGTILTTDSSFLQLLSHRPETSAIKGTANNVDQSKAPNF